MDNKELKKLYDRVLPSFLKAIEEVDENKENLFGEKQLSNSNDRTKIIQELKTKFKKLSDSDKLKILPKFQNKINDWSKEHFPFSAKDFILKDEYKHPYIFDEVSDLSEYIDDELNRLPTQKIDTEPVKYYVKYYALYHWILIEMGKEKGWELNENKKYPKSIIIQFAENRYKLKDGQGFYREFISMDINDKMAIVRSIRDKDFKNKLIDISNNDANIIHHLKQFPNL